MRYNSADAEKRAAFAVADLMAAAARTAPKACGVDNIEVIILDAEDKDKLADEMRKIAEETGAAFFERDAGNLDNSHCIVLIGVKNSPLGLDDCGFCGFKNCGEMKNVGTNCAFNITDLGIAVGSAASIAADNRMDNRVLFTAGKAAVSLKIFDESVNVCYGIGLATSSKNIFFDRAPGCVMV